MHIPFFSIIVPVYNVEQYLNTCIRSILQQDLTNFELFLLDDGSSDSSGKICDYFANKDNRITVFHSHNVGLSATRNTGISKSKGEYLWFIDSDDWLISTSALSTISKRIYEKNLMLLFILLKNTTKLQIPFQKAFSKIYPKISR
jgi:glycosyltransferase involved in cell wall biosynthesis